MHTGPLSLGAQGPLPVLLTAFSLVCRLLSPSSLKTFSEYQPHFPFLCCLFKGQLHSRFSRVFVEWSPLWDADWSCSPQVETQEITLSRARATGTLFGIFQVSCLQTLKTTPLPLLYFSLCWPVVAMEPELGENTHIHLENLAFAQMSWSKRELIG